VYERAERADVGLNAYIGASARESAPNDGAAVRVDR
jgi:hypothetical protein